MTLTPCAPCDCIGGNISDQKFKQDLEIILCGLIASNNGLTNVPAVTMAFGSISGTYATSAFTPAESLRQLAVYNSTDKAVQLSYDAGATNGPVIPAGASRVFDFAADGGLMDVNTVFVKSIGGSPGSGSVILDGFY